jgi:hypothetical protein
MTDGSPVINSQYYMWPTGVTRPFNINYPWINTTTVAWPTSTVTWDYTQPMPTGWVCPRCEKIWAPSVSECSCSPVSGSAETPEADCD